MAVAAVMSPLAVVISDDRPALTGEKLRALRRDAWKRWRILLVRQDELTSASDRAAVESLAKRLIG